MNSSSAGNESRLHLSPDQIGSLFPFHVVFDRDMKVTEVGRSMAKLFPDLQVGTDITAQWALVSPMIPFVYDEIVAHEKLLFIVLAMEGGLRLRGQMLAMPGREGIAFIGSPWLPEAGQFRATGLTFEDFAIHDSMPEFMQVVQSQRFGMDDLRKLTDKLRHQRESLKQVNQKLTSQAAEFQKLAMIAARTDNGVVITDANGSIEWVNEGFVRATGYSAEEVKGKQPGQILYGEATDPAIVARMNNRTRRGEGFKGELVTYDKNGTKRWVALEVQPMRDESGKITNFMAMDRDITARKQADFRKTLAFAVSTILAESIDTGLALHKILHTIVEAMDYRFSVVWRLNPAGTAMYPHTIWSPRELRNSHFENATRGLELKPGIGLPGTVWETNAPRWMPELAREGNFVRIESAIRDGLRSGFAFPIRVDGQPCGVMEFYSRNTEKPDEELLNTLTTLGNQIGQFMERQDAEKERSRLVSLLHSTLESTADGILVVDLQRRFVTWNRRFVEMWQLGSNLAPLEEHTAGLMAAAQQVADPDEFVSRAGWWYEHPEESGEDLIYFKDGRVLARTTQPQRDSGVVIGRVWSYRDVTERWQAEQALRESEERYRVISSSASDAIIVVNRLNSILFANDTGHRIFGYDGGELIGLNLKQLMAASYKTMDARALARIMRNASGSKGPKTAEIMGLRRNGDEFPLEITFGKSHIRGERVITGVMRDITERRQAEEDRRRAMKEVEQANRAKSDFLATISHEIRTPLNSIAGLTGLLRETKLDHDQRSMLDTVWAGSESLLHLINDLLDVSKVEAGQVDIVTERMDPVKVCERALEIVKTRAKQKGLLLVCTVEPGAPPSVLGDANRIGQILVNLLSNGVKFTPQGYVTLNLRWSLIGQDTAGLEFRVRDTGIGIGEQDSSRVFEKFYRIDSATGRQAGGTGLGLSISRLLAEAMGGSLTLTPEHPHGSCFTLNLHLPLVASPKAPEVSHPMPTAILLADLRHARLLQEAWTSAGVAVVPFENPLAAIGWIESDEPCDLVLMEEGVAWDPGELKRLFGVLALRGKVRCIRMRPADGSVQEGWAPPNGAVETVDHPLTPTKMNNVLRRAMRGVSPESASRISHEASSASQVASPSRVLLVEDNPDSAVYAQRVLEKAGHRVVLSGSVEDAVAKVQRDRFDLILMDVMLPDGSGFEATRRIREHEKSQNSPRIPVVALTAHALLEYRDQAYSAEMDDYLTKPIRQETLLSTVKKWSKAALHSGEEPSSHGTLESTPVLVDPDIADLIPTYLANVRKNVAEIGDLVARGEGDEVRKLGHNLKGTGTTYGFTEISRFGATIESRAREGDVASAGDAALALGTYLEGLNWQTE